MTLRQFGSEINENLSNRNERLEQKLGKKDFIWTDPSRNTYMDILDNSKDSQANPYANLNDRRRETSIKLEKERGRKYPYHFYTLILQS